MLETPAVPLRASYPGPMTMVLPKVPTREFKTVLLFTGWLARSTVTPVLEPVAPDGVSPGLLLAFLG